MPAEPRLSKSRLVSGRQCALRLYREVRSTTARPPPGVALQAVFDQARQVEALARSRHPGGRLIALDARHHAEAERQTAAAMADPAVPSLFEAAFTHDGVRIRADVLVRRPDGRWDLEEIKATTRVKDVHRYDVATQVYVLRGCGVVLGRIDVVHLDRGYERGPDGLDVHGLFLRTDVSASVEGEQVGLAATVVRLREVLAADQPPQVAPGAHCTRPRTCPFLDQCCTAPGPTALSVLPASASLERRMAPLGVTILEDLPPGTRLSPLHQRVRDCVLQDRDHVGPGLRATLEGVQWPLGFLDFETWSPAVPPYPGTRPFQALPTQWSLHTLAADGTLSHADHLHDSDSDPRPGFVDSLLAAVGEHGTVVVYSAYERRILSALAAALPDRAARVEGLIARFQDLLVVLRKDFYTPALGGSFSIKSVLPALVPDLDYSGLAIGDGQTAAAAYGRMVDPETPPDEAARLRQALLDYCRQDTLAMVEVRRAVLGRCP